MRLVLMDTNEPTPTADMPRLTWGTFAKECAIKFGALEQMALYAVHCEDLAGKVRVYVRLNELCGELRQLARDVESEVSEEVERAGKKLVVDGIGEVESAWSSQSQSWDMPALVSAIVARKIDEPETIYDEDGDRRPYAVIAQNIANALTQCVAMTYGRVGLCEAYGVDARRYRSFNGSPRRTLKLPKAKHDQ